MGYMITWYGTYCL